MVFIRLHLIEREDEIIKYLMKQPNSAMVQRTNGSYDIIVNPRVVKIIRCIVD